LWVIGNFPSSWSEAGVIPIPKPGKDLTDPGNYRPIVIGTNGLNSADVPLSNKQTIACFFVNIDKINKYKIKKIEF